MDDLGSELESMLKEAGEKELKAFERAYRSAVIDTLSQILIDTPVDKGSLRGAWLLGDSLNASDTGRASKDKGQNYIKTKMGQLKSMGETLYFYNNMPYAEVVEYGNYPDPVDQGTYNKRREKYEIRSDKGFSKLAPEGMVRLNTMGFNKLLKRKWSRQRGNI